MDRSARTRLRRLWHRTWIATTEGEEGEGLSGWLFLTVPVAVGLLLLTGTGFPFAWFLVTCVVFGMLIAALLLLAHRRSRRDRDR